jgi:Fe-S-cluster containining protein
VSRRPLARYVDPLAEVWLGAAARIGLHVVRSPDAYAATDGHGTLVIGTDETLDADDSLAQMIFHELCHALVAGPEAFAQPDWGLDNIGDGDAWRERATLRLQVTLARRYGLERLFAPTTDYRAEFWDVMPADPLADRGDPSVVAAIAGLARVGTPPWAPALEDALAATAAIVGAATGFAADAARQLGGPSLASGFRVPPPHPTGLPAGPALADDDPAAGRGCASCAWRYVGGPGRKAARCRQAAGAIVDDGWPACERWEPALDCQACGACCREAYHAVAVAPRDPVRRARPDYVVDRGAVAAAAGGDRYEIRRDGDRCSALAGGEPLDTTAGPRRAGFRCVIYDDRPRTCREFTAGSTHCLTARRRVGLSLGRD